LVQAKLIGCLTIKEDHCEDITENGLSAAELQFTFEQIEN